MPFTLSFSTSNAAFQDGDCAYETATILRNIADEVENGRTSGSARDINGNTVGSYELQK